MTESDGGSTTGGGGSGANGSGAHGAGSGGHGAGSGGSAGRPASHDAGMSASTGGSAGHARDSGTQSEDTSAIDGSIDAGGSQGKGAGGCGCNVVAADRSSQTRWMILALVAVAAVWRRRRSRAA
jgi:MYXO-CTERM domain-containing protein